MKGLLGHVPFVIPPIPGGIFIRSDKPAEPGVPNPRHKVGPKSWRAGGTPGSQACERRMRQAANEANSRKIKRRKRQMAKEKAST